jgi:hypothetical protein
MEIEEITTALARLAPPGMSTSVVETSSEPHETQSSPPKTYVEMTRLLTERDPQWWAGKIGLDTSHHPRVAKLAEWAGYFIRRTLSNNRTNGTWLVLDGPTGTGKTTVGRWCSRVFNAYSVDAFYAGSWGNSHKPSAGVLSWSQCCIDLERNGSQYKIDEAMGREVLVIDDVGSESDRFRSGSSKAQLRDLLEDCRNKWLLISMNIEKKDWLDVFGARVADRLDAAKIFSTTGIPSYRSKLRGEK